MFKFFLYVLICLTIYGLAFLDSKIWLFPEANLITVFACSLLSEITSSTLNNLAALSKVATVWSFLITNYAILFEKVFLEAIALTMFDTESASSLELCVFNLHAWYFPKKPYGV